MKILPTSLFSLLVLTGSSHAALLLHYAFDEGSGTTVTDSSGNGRDLTLNGGSTWNATGGAFGGSVNLGGALARAGGVSASTISSLNTVTGNQVTIAFWANVNSESVGSNPFTISNSNNSVGTRILQAHLEWSDGTTYFDAAWDVSSANRVSGDLGDVSSDLNHYIFTYDGDAGQMAIYKNNVLQFSNNSAPGGAINWAGIQNFELGAFSFNNGLWAGEMDDFAMWNEVLDEQDRTQIFNSGVASIPEPSGAALLGLAGLGFILRRRR
ncbi:PEP-CTERM protein-sorting domain-containing protein/MYXO-CTERM domain-containing protein [Rubritalea squalenifaciens DSM 18772]|uniref:PEP-CTERM protein-sorting domain-containing protein/MYXO-CTERM domain-containing protein n=1 Tax=Rubritalea squalenifaciens DSM 18772 TaxID=1123071 RepID=A0A1M6BEF8_9BACT|nr:LamG-like jellyroll fold domain-containing protein [Rubritalea squalenifaciens]SHI47144.1 PEP-CTERM protein-sorting domain-containing protein/MYXO-CTERM domain-containing protein [Rubritalea squalenifaciens DSM 18772]